MIRGRVYHNKCMLFHRAGSDIYQGYRQKSLLQIYTLYVAFFNYFIIKLLIYFIIYLVFYFIYLLLISLAYELGLLEA